MATEKMTFPATITPTRLMLKRICKEIENPEFTSLLRLDCVGVIQMTTDEKLVLTFLMKDENSARALTPRLMQTFKPIQKLFKEEADTDLVNILTRKTLPNETQPA